MPHPTGRFLPPPVCFLGIPQNWVRSCGIWDGTDIYRTGMGRDGKKKEKKGGRKEHLYLPLPPFFYVMHVAPWRLSPI